MSTRNPDPRSFTLRRASLAALLALLCAACGTNTNARADAGSGGGTGGGSGGGAGSAGGGAGGSSGGGAGGASGNDGGTDAGSTACDAPGYSPAVTSFVPGSISATVEDGSGAPIAGAYVSVTGLNLSFPGTTAADGTVTVDASHSEDNPAFKVGDSLAYGEFAIPLSSGTTTVGTVHIPALPATGAALTPGTSASSGGITLTLDPSTDVEIDTLSYSTADQQQFRAAILPIALAPVNASLGFEMLFGTTPLETTFCPPAKVSIQNSLGWAAGTRVDIYGQGLDSGQLWAPYGGWVKLATGQVTSDGTAIETSSGEGLPVLMTLALKRE